MKKLFSAIWKGLGEKGKFATIIGLLFATPYNAKFMWDFFSGSFVNLFIENQDKAFAYLVALAVINGIAMAWFILPSRVTFEGGKFKFLVED